MDRADDSVTGESPAAFNKEHYPNGLNSNFLDGSTSDVVASGVKKFENPETRDIARALPEVMEMLKATAGLSQNSVIADIGSGTGLFLESLSAAAETVFAMEISPQFVEHLGDQVQAKGLTNVTVVQGTSKDPCLPSSVDVALVCDVYHHFEFPRTFCKHLAAALRPGGRLVVIDFIRDEAVHKSHPQGWVTDHVRAGQEVFREEIESVGFRHVAEPAIATLVENYCMIFERS
mmetsp:Transcript_33331/g.89229  ORF Transcript_33331/g.89229 Transcript_33331/m.89229 type:complete len:233 (-) Transcript_33331:69-767(-)